MARVPRADQQIATAPLNPAFQQGAGASEAAFGAREGAAAQRTGGRAQQLSNTLQAQALRIQRAENDRAAKDMDIRLSESIRPLLHGSDTQDGLFNMTSQNAVDAAPGVVEAINKARSQILASAPNSRVKADWGVSSELGLQGTFDQIGRHTAAQRKRSQIDSTVAWRNQAMSDALLQHTDPISIERGRSSIRIATEDLAELNGWSEEVANIEFQTQVARLHAGVVETFLAPGGTAAVNEARAYYNANKDDIAGFARADIEKAIRASSNTNKQTITREVREAIDLLEADKDVPNIDQIQQSVAGLGDAGAELQLGLDRALADRPIMAEFNQLSISERQEVVASGRARESMTPDEFRVLEKQERALKEDILAINRGDGIQVAMDNKLIPSLNEMEFGSAQSWQDRVALANTASEELGVNISPLTSAETNAMATALTTGSQREVLSVLNAMVEGGGSGTADVMAQEFVEDHPGVAMAIGIVNDDFDAARLILQGEQRMAENANLRASNEDVNPEKERIFEGLFDETSDGDTLAAIDAGARAYMAGSGDPSRDIAGDFDPDEYRTAVERVTGGILTNTQGRKVIAPVRGMRQAEFDAMQRTLTAEDIMNFGNGVPVFSDGSPVPASILEDGAELQSTGPGQYTIHVPGQGWVHNTDGNPYEIDLGRLGQENPDIIPSEDEVFQDRIRQLGAFAPEQEEGLPSFIPNPQQRQRTDTVPDRPRAEPDAPLVDIPTPATPPRGMIDQDRRLINQLTRHEGFSSVVYEDTTGNATIGFGHKLREGEEFGDGITPEQARTLLRKDMAEARRSAKSFSWYKKLDPVRQNVVTDMIFNLGPQGFAGFKNTIAAIERGDFEEASEEMLDSLWHDQVGGRARRLAEQMRTGRF